MYNGIEEEYLFGNASLKIRLFIIRRELKYN